jgi:hypothetical protein
MLALGAEADWAWVRDELAFAWMTQLTPTFGSVIDDVRGAAAMLGAAAARTAIDPRIDGDPAGRFPHA